MQLKFCIGMVLLIISIGTMSAEEQNLELDWIRIESGTPIDWVYVSAFEITEHRIYVAAASGIFFSENDGETWSRTRFERGDGIADVLAVSENTIYAGTSRTGIFRSDDMGETWKPINNGIRFQEVDGEIVYPPVYDILIDGDTIINVMYSNGTYISTNRGETWQNVSVDWLYGASLKSLTTFDGYLWSSTFGSWMARSPDEGQTWQQLDFFDKMFVNDWEEFNGELYVAGDSGVGRWNEINQLWEYPIEGLPIGVPGNPDREPAVYSLASRGGYLFAGLEKYGVYAFDPVSETWSAAGLQGLQELRGPKGPNERQDVDVTSLVSHGEHIYAGTRSNKGVYRAKLYTVMTSVQPQGKLITTWSDIKQNR